VNGSTFSLSDYMRREALFMEWFTREKDRIALCCPEGIDEARRHIVAIREAFDAGFTASERVRGIE
jgi:hypothetical protein